MERQILVPLDGSARAEAAIPHAALLARSSGSTLRLLRTVVPATARIALAWPLPAPVTAAGWIQMERKAAHHYLGLVAAQLRAAGLDVVTSVAEGNPAESILGLASATPAIREIVIASHGRRGIERWVWGSVTEKVLRATPVPLFVVPVHQPEEAPEIAPPHQQLDLDQRYTSILVPLDGSIFAEQALEPARRLARHCGATLVLLSVIPAPAAIEYGGAPYWTASDLHGFRDHVGAYLAEVAGRLAKGGIAVQPQIVEGAPARAIIQATAYDQADLVVMTTHGRSGLSRAWLGSVASSLIERSNVPVLLIRAEEARREHLASQPALTASEKDDA